MKTFKNLNGTFGAAALLLGAMAFTACSSDDIANVNPTFDGESVKTQFAINIPYAGQKGTRMGANETQENNHFLGMYDIKLIPMTTAGAANTDITGILSLDNITSSSSDGDNESWETTNNPGFRKIYNDVNVPVGTKNFLFYGAGRNNAAAPSLAEDKFANGIIDATVAGNNTDNISFALQKAQEADNGQCEKLISALNTVAQTSGWSAETSGTLFDLYKSFTSLKAGSAKSICATLQSLYNAVNKITGDETATKIKEAIESLNDGFIFNNGTITTTLTYPQNMNMPDGAAVIKCEDGTFSAVEDNDVIPSGSSQHIKMANICYPASIYYFVNTALAANDASEVAWPGSLNNWESGFTTGWGNEVTASTRTIALKKPIQYGVAKLKTTVKCESTSLPDKKGTMISIPADGFPVTAVLVGGQPVKANWDFHPNGAVNTWTNVVYDKTIGDMKAATAASSPNYTLVLDNNNIGADAQEVVYIVIELENRTTMDFVGNSDQIIPARGKFYLVAKLDPKDKTVADVTNPSVFMQDYTTTANLTITSLANAYNVIPDLRASQMQLGLAVDLEWKQGIEFNVSIGGND